MGVLRIQEDGSAPTLSAQFSNFPLAPSESDFGADIVETMAPGDALIVLFEYDPASANTALFSHDGVPLLTSRDFTPDHLQHSVPGQSGVQRFFRQNGRGFCLYVVVGSHLDRADSIGSINQVLETLAVS